MTRHTASSIGGFVFAVVLAAFLTWPQAVSPVSMIAAHHDAQFSIWRLAWIAHALATAPGDLFNANIFYPAKGTLAYSDATMLQGIVGAPLFWIGLPPALIYNLLLLTGIAGSGAAMFTLARRVTGDTGPALVAATVFTMLPYRIEHFMHLELQWAMFVPLAFWAWHRAVDSWNWLDGALAGACLALQAIACVYYGAFLAVTLVLFVPLIVLLYGQQRVTGLLAPVAAAIGVAALLTLPFAWPYLSASRTLGGRDVAEIARYSARPINYLATSSLNWLWGWTADRWGASELRLFPGLVSIALAAFAIVHHPRRPVVLYALTASFAADLSLGSNGIVYPLLADRIPAFQGFRALSRFAVIASCAWAMLAGLGTQALVSSRLSRRWRTAAVPLVLGLMLLDYANRPMSLMAAEPVEPPDLYRVLKDAEPGVVLELPMPGADRLPGRDPQYQVWSLWHWRPLMNGYSGYYPQDYFDTVTRMVTFPDDGSVNRLRAHHVKYVIVHREFYDAERYTSIMLRLATRPEFKPWGAYRDSVGRADIFEFVARE